MPRENEMRAQPDGSTDEAARSAAPPISAILRLQILRRIIVGEEGYINFVSCFLFMAFVIGLTLVGNVGMWTNDHIELQNAADSGAYSAALQMARGMNAITATNHMMGEVTGLVVILDSLVGRECVRGEESGEFSRDKIRDIREIRDINKQLVDAKKTSIFRELHGAQAGYDLEIYRDAASFINQADKTFVEQVVSLFAENGEIAPHESGGAVYDAQFALKQNLKLALDLKNICTQISDFGRTIIVIGHFPPLAILKGFGWGLEAAALTGHVFVDVEMLGITKEWLVLEAIEQAMKLPFAGKFIAVAEDLMIPALSSYSDSVVGDQQSPNAGTNDAPSGPMNVAINQCFDELRKGLSVNQIVSYPSAAGISLPVMPEDLHGGEKTAANSTGADKPANSEDMPKLWIVATQHNDDEAEEGPLWKLQQFIKRALGPLGEINNEVADVLRIVNKVLDATGPFGQLAVDLVSAFDKGDAEKIRGLLDLNFTNQMGHLFTLLETLDSVMDAKRPSPKGYDHNPSRKWLAAHSFDWAPEQKTQWTRATYPYVDLFRAPIRQFFRESAGVSNASTYYANWTSCYTIVDSYHIRHDKPKPLGGDSGTGKEDTSKKKSEPAWINFVKQLLDLRKRFDALQDGAEDDGATTSTASSAREVQKISDGVLQLANLTRVGGNESLISQLGVPISDWINRAASHQKDAKSYAASLPPIDSEVSDADYRKLAEDVALISELDELLKMLNRDIDRLKHLLSLPFDAPPHMYVMLDSTPDTKGIEPWVKDVPLDAEKMFTVMTFACRTGVPQHRFMPSMFQGSGSAGRVCLAQAMVYNANGLDLAKASDELVQPNTGWDTLNWLPPVQAPDWAAKPFDHGTGQSSANLKWNFDFPFSVFEGSTPEPRARVHLNWQAKLVPITATRFRDAIDVGGLPEPLQKLLQEITDEDVSSLIHY